MLNVLQRVGGSVGTAVLAVVLQREITAQVGTGGGGGLEAARSVSDAARERVAEPLAAAFAHTYWWAMAMTALAIIPAMVLALTERRAAPDPGPGADGAGGARAGAVAADGATPPESGRSPRPGRAPARLR
jgi:hypothetical protein